MSGPSLNPTYVFHQEGNRGHTEGIHYGDTINNYHSSKPLSPKEIAERVHNNVKKGRKDEGTCDWLVERDEFKECVDGESKCSVLWIHGRLGCGKSTLMSRVIDYLSEMENHPAVHLLYFYIPVEKGEKKSMKDLITTFFDQASAQCDTNQLSEPGSKDPVEMQRVLFNYLTQTERRVYIVVDAVDQFNDKNREKLLSGLDTLAKQVRASSSQSRLAIIVSSRDRPGLEMFQEYRVLQIEVRPKDNAHDIRKYLERKLESNLLRGKRPHERKHVKTQVMQKLTEHAGGMFLWVKLQAMNICDNQLKSDILEALENLTLPENMDKMYREYAEAFESQNSAGSRQIATRATALLAHATRSIPQRAMLIALAIKTADGVPDKVLLDELGNYPEQISTVCKHLVEINEELGVFQFCHGSVYDFFRSYKPAENHAVVADISLSHLCSKDFSRGPFEGATWFNPGPLESFVRENPFLEVASCNWAISTKKSGKMHQSQLQRHFAKLCKEDEQSNICLSFQVYLLTLGKSMAAGVCHAHIFSYFGLIDFFEEFHRRGWMDPGKCDKDGLTALHWVMKSQIETRDEEKEIVPVVQWLIEHGGKVNTKDNEGRTPLYYAAWHGKLGMVELLLAKKAKVDVSSKKYGTALLVASHKDHSSYKDHKSMTETLLKAGANINNKSALGTPLHAISSSGCFECAKMMFDKPKFLKKARSDVYGGHFGTALHAAAYNGHPEIVKLLLEQKFNSGKMSDTYGSTLTAAAAGCYESVTDSTKAGFVRVFELLIADGVDVNAFGGIHGTALHATATLGHKDLVELLLNKEADVTISGSMGTAYQAASDGGYDDIMSLLMERDPRANSGDENTDGRPFYPGESVEDIPKPLHQHWVRLFNFAVATNDQKRINFMISSAEKVFERAIKQRQNNVVSGLASVGEAVFEAVIMVATERQAGKTTASRETILDIEDKLHRTVAKLGGRLMWLLDCFGSNIPTGGEESSLSARRPRPHRQPTFDQDNLEGNCPHVLNRLTQAAVLIMQRAFINGNGKAVDILAKTWTDALYKVMSRGDYGKKMLEILVQNRAAELKEILTNEKLEPTERFEEAERLAEVGVELLITALQRGQEYKPLASSLAKLWVTAIDDVEHLGGDRQGDILRLVLVFAGKFENAVDRRDRVRIEQIADAGIEIMKMTGLSNCGSLMDTLAEIWTQKWSKAIGKNMGASVDRATERRVKEFEDYVKAERQDEALGLAAAGLALLRASLSSHLHTVVEKLLAIILQEVEWTIINIDLLAYVPTNTDRTQTASITMACPKARLQLPSILYLIDTVANVISVAKKEENLTAWNSLLQKIVQGLEKTSKEWQNALIALVNQLFRKNQPREETCDPQLQSQQKQISRAVIHLLSAVQQTCSPELQPPRVLIYMGLTILDVIRQEANCEEDRAVVRFLERRQRDHTRAT